MIVSSIVRPVSLVLLWHMHQPEYRDYASGQFRQPWVYLRATKDYADMARRISPGTCCV
jgi:alpha-amylase/alpha-mannosidase (GH57 family)